jgi:hypothetical protein
LLLCPPWAAIIPAQFTAHNLQSGEQFVEVGSKVVGGDACDMRFCGVRVIIDAD